MDKLNLTEIKAKHFETRFESIGELVSLIKSKPEIPGEAHSQRISFQNFCETKSMDQALDLAIHGWSEKLPELDQQLSDLDDKLGQEMPEESWHPHFDVAGGMVDVDRFLSGEPECMIDWHSEMTDQGKRHVRILVNTSKACGISTSAIIKNGVTICALINQLHKMGYGIELETVNGIAARSGGTARLTIFTTIKQSADQLDLGQILFCLAHPSFLRRFIFCVMDHTQYVNTELHNVCSSPGYGFPVYEIASPEHDIVINSNINEDPTEFIKRTIEGLNDNNQ